MAKRLALKTKEEEGEKGEGEGTRRREVNVNAHRIVTIATQKGLSYEDIGGMCGVSVGSVKRWLATGRANADAIRPLVQMVGNVHLKPEAVADILIEIYKKRKKRFRLTRSQLKRISGRAVFKSAFLEALAEVLLARNYHFIEESEDKEDFFVVIKSRQLRSMVKDYLADSEISHYYHGISEDGSLDED